jgi:hypothetical protein
MEQLAKGFFSNKANTVMRVVVMVKEECSEGPEECHDALERGGRLHTKSTSGQGYLGRFREGLCGLQGHARSRKVMPVELPYADPLSKFVCCFACPFPLSDQGLQSN